MSLHITGGEVPADALVRADLSTNGETIAGLGDAAPADALRLDATCLSDRGVIASGKRADLVLVAPEPQPRVVATIAGGQLVHLADQRILI